MTRLWRLVERGVLLVLLCIVYAVEESRARRGARR